MPIKPKEQKKEYSSADVSVARAVPPPDREPPPVWSIIAQIGFVVVAAVAVYTFVSTSRDGEARRRCAPTCLMKPDYAGFERKAPDFALADMKGQVQHLSDYRGKVVVLNFWTKTCGPCMEEMPDIAELTKILKPYSDVAVVTISIDDGPADVKDTLHGLLREDPPFTVLFDPEDKTVREVFGTRLFPETWIIDKNGVIRARFDGAREWNNSAALELVHQIREGGFCPLEVKQGKPQGDGQRLCESLTGG
jgi:peroxiredoxin